MLATHLHLHVIIGLHTLRLVERLPSWLLDYRVTWAEALEKIQKDEAVTATVASVITTQQVLAAYDLYTGRSSSN